jgi:hypothetical protein
MDGLVGTYGYLTLTSWRNRLSAQLRRLRSPRYALGLALGVGYIWYFLIGQPAFRDRRGPNIFDSATFELITSFGVLLVFMRWWLFGNDRSALAFTPAEVQFLFPAPLSRRSLIQFKLLRAQFAILVNALLLTFIFGRGGAHLPSILRVFSLWALFSVFMLHRLGATLVRTAAVQHGTAGAKRNVVPLIVFGGIAGMFLWTAISLYPQLRDAPNPGEAFDLFKAALRSPLPHAVLTPFRMLLAPSFATSVAEWMRAIPFVLAAVVLHYVWVIRTESAFEDAAVAASAERAKRIEAFRARRGGVAKAPKAGRGTWIPLAPTGIPAVAIVWKNMLSLTRTGSAGGIIGGLTIFTAVMAFSFASESGSFGGVISLTALFVAGASIIVGARFIRIDLRHDLLHQAALRSYPLSGSAIVAAEIAGPTLVLTLVQCGLLLVVAVEWPHNMPFPIEPGVRALILVAALPILLVINSATVMLQNAAALIFPGWVRLGVGPAAGVEVLGQNLLMMLASLVALALVLLPPGVLAAVVFLGIQTMATEQLGWAILASVVVFVGALAAEVVMAVVMLGDVFERGEKAG